MRSNPYLRKTGIWFYGDMDFVRMGNPKGTASTLDNTVGNYYYQDSADETKVWGEPVEPVELCDGLLSKNGFTVFDDSHSLLFTPDGWVKPAPKDHIDIYFMCCGRDYRGTLDLFFRLSGKTPMLPRWALGNWWSRYYSYTQEEYMALRSLGNSAQWRSAYSWGRMAASPYTKTTAFPWIMKPGPQFVQK